MTEFLCCLRKKKNSSFCAEKDKDHKDHSLSHSWNMCFVNTCTVICTYFNSVKGYDNRKVLFYVNKCTYKWVIVGLHKLSNFQSFCISRAFFIWSDFILDNKGIYFLCNPLYNEGQFSSLSLAACNCYSQTKSSKVIWEGLLASYLQ